MKFETLQIQFLSEFSVCCDPEILLPWQRDVTSSPLHYLNCSTNDLLTFKIRNRLTFVLY